MAYRGLFIWNLGSNCTRTVESLPTMILTPVGLSIYMGAVNAPPQLYDLTLSTLFQQRPRRLHYSIADLFTEVQQENFPGRGPALPKDDLGLPIYGYFYTIACFVGEAKIKQHKRHLTMFNCLDFTNAYKMRCASRLLPHARYIN